MWWWVREREKKDRKEWVGCWVERQRERERQRESEWMNEIAHQVWMAWCFLLDNSFGRKGPFPLQQVTTSFHYPFLSSQSHCHKKNSNTLSSSHPLKQESMHKIERGRCPAQREWETQQRMSSCFLLGLWDPLHLPFLRNGLKELQTGTGIPNSAFITIKSPTAKILNTLWSSLQ